MGIEPTRHRFGRLTGFEDRGGHQTRKRFLVKLLIPIREGTLLRCYVRIGFLTTPIIFTRGGLLVVFSQSSLNDQGLIRLQPFFGDFTYAKRHGQTGC